MKKLTVTLIVIDIIITAICLIGNFMSPAVIFGMVYGFVFAELNFILLGTIVEKALSMDERGAKRHMRINYAVRFVLMAVILAIPFLSDKINPWCVVVSTLSPKLTYFAIGYFDIIPKKKGRD